jgi:uncharacterized membrane protein
MAAAVLTVAALAFLLPDDFRALPGWIFQLLLLVFLVVLVIGDPGRIDRDSRWLHLTTNLMIAVITVGNMWAAGRLVRGILTNAKFTDAQDLLQIGASVWLVNVIAFALWYWHLDCGGAAARARASTARTRAFVFPESDLPEHVDGLWYPQFVDYLAMSFNTATAFSPTDVSAVKPWAKLLVMAESSVSLVVALLVIARAINIFPAAGS